MFARRWDFPTIPVFIVRSSRNTEFLRGSIAADRMEDENNSRSDLLTKDDRVIYIFNSM